MTNLLEQKRCPQCHGAPEVEYKDDLYWLFCEEHGHMACGESMVSAIANWNHYIGLMVGREMARAIEAKNIKERVL